jgi:hypothetical protein
MFWISTILSHFWRTKAAAKRWPLISGGFMKQKAAAKVCNKPLSVGQKTAANASFWPFF